VSGLRRQRTEKFAAPFDRGLIARPVVLAKKRTRPGRHASPWIGDPGRTFQPFLFTQFRRISPEPAAFDLSASALFRKTLSTGIQIKFRSTLPMNRQVAHIAIPQGRKSWGPSCSRMAATSEYSSRAPFASSEHRQMSTRIHLEYVSSNRRHCLKTTRDSPGFRHIPGIRRAFSAVDILVLAVCFQFAGHSSAQTVEESRVKAAYLYNFAKFVEWPSEVFQNPGDPAVICVVGDERTSDVLEPAVSGKKVNGRPVEARRPRSPAEFKSCHVLFIGFSDKESIAELLNRLQRSSVLTVGQSDQFIRLGGMINLALKNTTIELEIDPEASNAAGLKISSRLLVVARLVKAPGSAGGER